MKTLLTVLLTSIALTQTAFAFGPFESFIGKYDVKNAPKITNNNIKHCNWFNFRNITNLEIDTINSNEAVKLTSITNDAGHTQSSYLTFVPYSRIDAGYTYSGTLSGDSNQATYVRTEGVLVTTWVMTKNESSYLLEITQNNTYKNVEGSCHYSVELQKVN